MHRTYIYPFVTLGANSPRHCDRPRLIYLLLIPTCAALKESHPLVQGRHVADKKPSYVQPKTFSLVLLDLLVLPEPAAPLAGFG